MKAPTIDKYRLGPVYYVSQISGLLVLLLFGVAIYIYQDLFSFLVNPEAVVFLFGAIFSIHLLCFLVQELTGWKWLFSLTRYAWVIFYILFIYVTGGIYSQFIFLLIFPLMVSVVDLDAGVTKRVGIITTILFALLIFTERNITTGLIVQHASFTILYAAISYYMSQIVKVTLRQKYEKEEIKRNFMQLTELERVKNDFIDTASHQLRTPLSGIRWVLENLSKDQSIKPETQTSINESLHEINRSLGIIDEMLKSSESEMQGFVLIKKPTSILSLVKNIQATLYLLTQEKKVDFSVSGADITAFVDAPRIEAALLNITDNAVRYSPQGKVQISLEQTDNSCIIKVTDNGIGIPEEDKVHLFERFYRGSNARSLDPNESGVGLYLSKQIIEKHGGSIEVQSEANKGTTVTVTLPLSL